MDGWNLELGKQKAAGAETADELGASDRQERPFRLIFDSTACQKCPARKISTTGL